MLVSEAKEVARRWVAAELSRAPGVVGAVLHGSINWLPDSAELPAASDVDLMVVLEEARPRMKLGKFNYEGIMLEVSYLPADRVRSAEQLLADYPLAGSFKGHGVLMDPTGRLTRLQQQVAASYSQRRWVTRRCDQARRKVLANLEHIDAAVVWPEQVAAWLFACGVTTHLLLVAGLRNPTVRLRYLAARQLLQAYGRASFYPRLIQLLGCGQMSQERVGQHIEALARQIEAATKVMRTPFFFASDISQAGQVIAVEGSRRLVAQGNHHEAIFWIAATFCRCQIVLHHDAPDEVRRRHAPAFERLLADLDIGTTGDLKRRSEQVRAFLPALWHETEAIMDANPAIDQAVR